MTETSSEKIKAVSLLSGGLDSILATRVIQDQGIDVQALHFMSPFFSADKRGREEEVAEAFRRNFGINVRLVDVSAEYLKLVANPRYGYGKNFNPCIDCKIFLFSRALSIMRETGAKFLITGEVIGQRPMSQRRDTMNLIARDMGARDILLRPLSAKIMEPTLPEREGWVDRDRLYGFSGRSRKPQVQLAKELGIDGYPTPAGGCVLTDPIKAARVARYFEHPLGSEPTVEDFEILLMGRTFRLPGGSLLVLGRDERENLALEKVSRPGDLFLNVTDAMGPVGLLRSPPGAPDERLLAASLVLRFCPKARPGALVACGPKPEWPDSPLAAQPADQETVESLRA